MAQQPPLMPKATAVWLVDNTALTFEQIADFCHLHKLEVKGIADGDVAKGIMGQDPTKNGQLTEEEIKRCEGDLNASLQLAKSDMPELSRRTKGPRYTPVARRQEKPDAIAWLVKTYPHLSDAQIIKLVGTTKNTIGAIRERTHWNMANLQPRDPVLLGICKQADLDAAVAKANAANPEAAAKLTNEQPMFDENQPKAVIPEGIFAAFSRENT
ncbi:MAG: DUF1013 domain-containing protein [Alphaproteobacteria bacterium]